MAAGHFTGYLLGWVAVGIHISREQVQRALKQAWENDREEERKRALEKEREGEQERALDQALQAKVWEDTYWNIIILLVAALVVIVVLGAERRWWAKDSMSKKAYRSETSTADCKEGPAALERELTEVLSEHSYIGPEAAEIRLKYAEVAVNCSGRSSHSAQSSYGSIDSTRVVASNLVTANQTCGTMGKEPDVLLPPDASLLTDETGLAGVAPISQEANTWPCDGDDKKTSGMGFTDGAEVTTNDDDSGYHEFTSAPTCQVAKQDVLTGAPEYPPIGLKSILSTYGGTSSYLSLTELGMAPSGLPSDDASNNPRPCLTLDTVRDLRFV